MLSQDLLFASSEFVFQIDRIRASRSSMHALPGLGAAVRIEQINLLTAHSGCQYHSFADSELHFSRREIGAQDHQPADKVFRLVGTLDSRENVTRSLASHAERQLQQLVRSDDGVRGQNPSDTKIDLREIVDRAMLGD